MIRSFALHLHDFITQLLHLLFIRRPPKPHPTHDRLQMRAAYTHSQPMPPHDAHPHTGHGVRLDIPHPPIHDLGIRVERLDSARVHAPREILLRLFVRERSARDSPERAARGEGRDAREGYAERGGRVGGEVRCELDRLGLVGAELDRRDGDAVGAWVAVCLENAASVHDFCVPWALFGV